MLEYLHLCAPFIFNKGQLGGRVQSAAYFYQESIGEAQPCAFIFTSSMAMSGSGAKPDVFTIWPFAEKKNFFL